ncbi:MAG: Ig-like domain-containing protein, partial [Lachnospiraceae bacterium]
MKKRILSLVMVLVFCFALFPVTVLAAGGGTITADSTPEAVKSVFGGNATVSGNVITLTGDVEVGATVTFAGGDWTLDLNGNTLFAPATKKAKGISPLTVTDGKLTIQGNGTISGGNGIATGGDGMVVNGGTAVVTGGSFTGGDGDSGNVGGDGIWVSGGTVKVTGGSFTGGYSDNGGGGGIWVSGGTAVVTGGSFTGGPGDNGGGDGICVEDGTAVVTGGSFTGGPGDNGGGDGIYVSDGTAVVTGGRITGGHGNYGDGDGILVRDGTALVTGGSFSGDDGISVIGGTAVVTGGTFSSQRTSSSSNFNRLWLPDKVGEDESPASDFVGSVTLPDLTQVRQLLGDENFNPYVIETDETLTIEEGESLTIPAGETLTNNGTIIVKDGGNLTGKVDGNGTVTPKIITTSLPEGTVGKPYTATLRVTGNNITWSVSNLPEWLRLDASTGEIYGTPTTAGVYNFAVTVNNNAGSDSWVYTLKINAVPVTGVTLNKTELSLYTGQSETLTATVEPENATNQNVTWSSDNSDVASVDENGKVTAVTAGEATITVTTEDGGKTNTCQVTVTQSTYSIFADPASLSFGSVYTGYAQPAAKTVTITNTGNRTLTLTPPVSTENFVAGTLSKTELPAGEKATFTVQPKTGLPVGTYRETITVSGSDGVALSIPVNFTVKRWNVVIPPATDGNWRQTPIGWWYQNPDGTYPANQWRYLDSGKGYKAWYWFNQYGYMTTGWQKVGNTWYYMNRSGEMQTGWVFVNS